MVNLLIKIAMYRQGFGSSKVKGCSVILFYISLSGRMPPLFGGIKTTYKRLLKNALNFDYMFYIYHSQY